MVATPASLGSHFDYKTSSDSPSSATASGHAALPNFSLIDLPSALKKWGEEAPFRTYLRAFASTYSDAAEQMRFLVATNKTSQAAALAHKVRGSSGALNLLELARRAGELETMLTQEQAVDEAAQSFCTSTQATLDAIDTYLASEVAVETHSDGESLLPTWNERETHRVTAILHELGQHLANDDLEKAEIVIGELKYYLAPALLQPLIDSLRIFDLSATSAHLQDLAQRLAIALIDSPQEPPRQDFVHHNPRSPR